MENIRIIITLLELHMLGYNEHIKWQQSYKSLNLSTFPTIVYSNLNVVVLGYYKWRVNILWEYNFHLIE